MINKSYSQTKADHYHILKKTRRYWISIFLLNFFNFIFRSFCSSLTPSLPFLFLLLFFFVFSFISLFFLFFFLSFSNHLFISSLVSSISLFLPLFCLSCSSLLPPLFCFCCCVFSPRYPFFLFFHHSYIFLLPSPSLPFIVVLWHLIVSKLARMDSDPSNFLVYRITRSEGSSAQAEMLHCNPFVKSTLEGFTYKR